MLALTEVTVLLVSELGAQSRRSTSSLLQFSAHLTSQRVLDSMSGQRADAGVVRVLRELRHGLALRGAHQSRGGTGSHPKDASTLAPVEPVVVVVAGGTLVTSALTSSTAVTSPR